ncbi:hypothetical protein OG884_26390 [Streptosporangium sp. NBC_01755]|uniref:hypothetical protein n=1 Tax=unclassified Streptosporangium TaxID=2632669 RepID=UPI002DDC8B74|nr:MULTISPECIES: hypothetical protein [unclassified Streptosporangium]WSA23417.1 hypothetical protein OIE13_20885 [Streptosporangium sp. NBC_01810]WSC98379.1 hypothetical protein OG884_26390 [Streptosporangium sp. NBC_01755]
MAGSNGRDLAVVAASTGGVAALRTLPAEWPRMLERAEAQGRKHSSQRLLEDAAQTRRAVETMRMPQSRIDGTGDGFALT